MPGTTRFVGPISAEGGVTLPAGDIVTADIASGAVTPDKLSQSVVTTAASSACAILDTTTELDLNATTGAVAITTTSSRPGQEVFIRMNSLSGGSYTLAVTGGTLTLNSVGEAAIVKRNAANDAWRVTTLTASSSTGANIATIV